MAGYQDGRPEERDAPNSEHKTAVLATWETSVGGIDWATKLIQEGKATQLSRSGYPNRYTANAGDVVPILVKGIPDHDQGYPSKWSRHTLLN